MAVRTKTEPPEGAPPGTPPADGGPPGDGSGGAGSGGGTLESRVDSLESKLDTVIAKLTPGGEPKPPADGGPPAGEPTTQKGVEDNMETKVRDALNKVRGEEEAAGRLAAVEQKVAAIVEQAPVKKRLSTRIMGW